MIAETISQANHCFTTSKHITNQTPKIRLSSEEVSIMPEMANAVVFPDTGKSLKHHELITTLRYKIIII
jgi:hypothetical protein